MKKLERSNENTIEIKLKASKDIEQKGLRITKDVMSKQPFKINFKFQRIISA